MSTALRCAGLTLPRDRPALMGILNVTPDSFSDGGRFLDPAAALAQARQMRDAGADIIDVGGESTRPGARGVPVQEELDRVIPVIQALIAELDVTVSVDSSKPEVMAAALAAGAGMINDVNALRAPGALELAAAHREVGVVLMHMQGEPRSMQQDPRYADVVAEVAGFLRARRDAALAAGIEAQRILVDPGIGFGKSLAHNLSLLKALPQLVEEFGPLLLGVSRKSMFDKLYGGLPVEQRVAPSVQAALLAAQAGAAILRVHDVAETAAALHLWQAIRTAD